MLAVKLHKRKLPWLGVGAYLIPIIQWKSAKPAIRLWIGTLNHHNRRAPNNKIRYITLIRVPSSHLVSLHFDWIEKHLSGLQFQPLDEIGTDEKARISKTSEEGWLPEMILGAPLPQSSVIWTKDVRLLYGGY